MINNFNQIENLLNFDNDDNFYFLQIIQRKKENKNLKKFDEIIKVYYITNLEQYKYLQDNIIKLCELFNARAMINLNKRSYKRIAEEISIITPLYIRSKNYRNFKSIYNSICGKYHNEINVKWIIDVDEKDLNLVNDIVNYIYFLRPYNTNKKIDIIESLNGYHIICKPFDINKFREKYNNIAIHKDNFTNLYIN